MKDNLFNYATNELSGSAFWTWLLISLCDDENIGTERYKIAKEFMAIVGLEDIKIGHVQKEIKIQGAGRADIVLYSGENKKNGSEENIIAIIENKTWSTAWAEDLKNQIKRYVNNVPEQSIAVKPIVMTFRHDTQQLWKKLDDTSDIVLLGLDKQCEIFSKFTTSNDQIINQYARYLNKLQETQKDRLNKLTKGCNLSTLENILEHHDSQWKFMEIITSNCKDDENKELDIYNGTSFGRAWTQASWTLDGNGYCFFFYRLDKDKRGYYLRLNNYRKDDCDDKQDFTKADVINFRKSAFNTCKELLEREPTLSHNINISIDYPKYINGKECTLWFLRFAENTDVTIQAVSDFIKVFHSAFIREFKTATRK